MRVPLAWLQHFLPSLPSTDKLVEALTMHGIEVETVIDQSNDFANVVVGEIVAIRPHPDADKLRIADVIVASGAEPQEIVCGAPNIAIGQKAPVALLGAKLPNGLTIARRAIRGVESNGMLCAADELGLGSDHSGILILDPAMKPGTPFAKAVGLDGVVLDLALPANRADLMSMRGIAREIAAILGTTYKAPAVKLQESGGRTSASVRANVASFKLASVYALRMIRGVSVQSSPSWLQGYLRQAGLRPINTIVDATNAVMLEYGQPLHAFDAAKVKGKITVRNAKAGETLVTLDGQTRHLDPSMTIIADASGPIALAGVMGGQATEVTASTKDVILEAAIFDPIAVRKTSRTLGLISEASKRFEKGLWLSLPVEANAAGAALMTSLSGGTVEHGAVVVGSSKMKPTAISFKPEYAIERLGQTIPVKKMKSILAHLGFEVTGTKVWQVTVPEWRLDVRQPEDLVDEIGRIVGYTDLPKSFPLVDAIPQALPRLVLLKEHIRDLLVDLGLTEVMTHSYYGQAEQQVVGGEHIAIANPLDTSQAYVRRSLTPAIKKILERSVDAGQTTRVFEISRVFTSVENIERGQDWKLAIGVAHKVQPGTPPAWKTLGILRQLSNGLSIDQPVLETAESETRKGYVMTWIQIDIHAMLQQQKPKKYIEHSKFPTVDRDISMFVPAGFGFERVQQAITELPAGDRLLLRMDLLGGEWFTKDQQTSVKVHVVFQAMDRTLTKPEIDAVMNRLTSALSSLGATIR